MRVPYYIGDLKRDPNLENYPNDFTLLIHHRRCGAKVQSRRELGRRSSSARATDYWDPYNTTNPQDTRAYYEPQKVRVHTKSPNKDSRLLNQAPMSNPT